MGGGSIANGPVHFGDGCMNGKFRIQVEARFTGALWPDNFDRKGNDNFLAEH